ncbi:MAG: MFS transporter [Hyphomicrobiaceae bacterium]|nr:MFS transporter [Hyphomicrobiaceae bacterium]
MSIAATDDSRQRRNVFLLAMCQALFMSIQAMSTATTPLAGYALLGTDKSLATLPLFLMHAGIMVTTIPASLLMSRIGRRGGFSIGAILGIASGLVSTYAIYSRSFPLLSVGAFLQGSAAAFAWYYRFAATDSAAPAFRAKAISLVMAGGVLAGLFGPEVAKWAVNWLSPVTFAGVYVVVAMFSLVVLMIVQALSIPRLTTAERGSGGRPLSVIARQPRFVVALISSMFGYGVMTLVMSATPLAMLDCGFRFNDSATVIQAHIVAMFLPAFFTGALINRFGVLNIIIAGAVIQTGCAIINLAGIGFMNFLIANILVGLGWNFTYVGGSTLLTSTYEPAERAKTQAAHDFTVYATTATAAAVAGLLQQRAGWQLVNIATIPLMVMVCTAAVWLALHLKQEARRAAQ